MQNRIAAIIIVSLFNTGVLFAGNGSGFTDAADFGFLPTETGINNAKALQAAVDKGGTIVIGKTGIYKIASTVFIGDSTSLIFGNGVVIEKSGEKGKFTHVF